MYAKRIVLGLVLSLVCLGACDPIEVPFVDAAPDAPDMDADVDEVDADVDADPGCSVVLECVNSDGCCPAGCNNNNDTDCQPACGNGAVESGETCDPLTSCPASCPQVGCQLRTLQNGGTCGAACANTTLQTACVDDDGCCPSGCNANNDSNCQPGCGNGVIESGETCDPLNTCPTSCPAQGCQLRTLQNGGTCSAQCVNAGMQTQCINNDGCCPSGCNANNDNNCQPVCGNGVVEGTETCDPQAPAPNNCQCAAEAYTCYGQTGSPSQCNVECHVPVDRCGIDGDGCCAFTGTGDCTPSNDAECRSRWRTYEWPIAINYSTDCFYPRVYGIEPGGSYLFTMCYPPGAPAPGGDPVINAVSDNLGNVYDVTNDNCSDTSALPYTARWRCENDQGQIRMFCASPSPGGFMIRGSNVSYLDLRICPRSSQTGGRGTMHIWYNAERTPTPG